jgi:hypothetical protein
MCIFATVSSEAPNSGWILFGWDGRCTFLVAAVFSEAPTDAGSFWVRWQRYTHPCSSLEWSFQQQLLLDSLGWDGQMHILAAEVLKEAPSNSCYWSFWVRWADPHTCSRSLEWSSQQQLLLILLCEIGGCAYLQQQSWMNLPTTAVATGSFWVRWADAHTCSRSLEWSSQQPPPPPLVAVDPLGWDRRCTCHILSAAVLNEARNSCCWILFGWDGRCRYTCLPFVPQEGMKEGWEYSSSVDDTIGNSTAQNSWRGEKTRKPQKERKETLGSARVCVVHHPESWQRS